MDAPVRTTGRWRRYLLFAHEGALLCWGLVAAGLLLDWMALPPGPLPMAIFFADLPFLLLLYVRGGRRWKRWALLFGALHYGFATRWLLEIYWSQVVTLMVILGPIYVLFGAFVRWLVRSGVPIVLSFAAVAVAEEMVRTIWMGGMPWPARSLSFAAEGFLDGFVPAASLFGAYGLSFFAASVSAAIAALLLRSEAPKRHVAWVAAVPLAALAVLLTTALLRTGAYDEAKAAGRVWAPPGEMLVVQGNIPQSLKNKLKTAGEPSGHEEIFVRHLGVTKQGTFAAPGEASAAPLFAVVWPETMLPWPVVDPGLGARFPRQWESYANVVRRMRFESGDTAGATWLVGAIHLFERPGDALMLSLFQHGTYDALFQLAPENSAPRSGPTPPPRPDLPDWRPAWELGRHDKHVLVPGGEYTPLGELFPILRWTRNAVSVIPELDRGAPVQPLMTLWESPAEQAPRRTLTSGTAICFELAFPARCRAWRLQGADVLVNAANYGWFGETGFRAQVRAIARLRAAELAMSIVMAGNTGPTAFFDPVGGQYGRFHTALLPAEESIGAPAGGDATTHRPGYARGRVFADEARTGYLVWGDGPWRALFVALLLLGVRASWRRRRLAT